MQLVLFLFVLASANASPDPVFQDLESFQGEVGRLTFIHDGAKDSDSESKSKSYVCRVAAHPTSSTPISLETKAFHSELWWARFFWTYGYDRTEKEDATIYSNHFAAGHAKLLCGNHHGKARRVRSSLRIAEDSVAFRVRYECESSESKSLGKHEDIAICQF